MSAPTKRDPLPVVECGISRPIDGVVAIELAVFPSDLPALAVPDALWWDDAFRVGATERMRRDDYATWFDAIYDELRARAGGGA